MPRRRDSRRDERDAERLLEQLVAAFMRLPVQARIIVVALVAVVAVACLIVGAYRQRHPAAQPSQTPVAQGPQTPPAPPVTTPTIPPQTTAGPASPHLTLGLPSPATTDPANRNDYLLVKPFFALSYNDANGTPNWVSWRVLASDLGAAPRKQQFDPEALLPAGFKVVYHNDYAGSGFDRGHLCPHSDRAATQEMSYATFVMSNIIPQAPNVNQKAWADAEEYLREQVRGGNRLYVVAGPWGRGGIGTNGPRDALAGARGPITVPSHCWKVAVVVPERGQSDDAQQFTGGERVIGIWMPNRQDVGRQWAAYRVSAGEIEQKTGLRFFSALPPAVADRLRARVDMTPVRSAAR